jgi:aryl-alcohol dehydrogenase-like predicted oxidoreductase
MKYRKLGRDGPRVSAIGQGRGAQPVKLEDEAMVKAFNDTIHRAYDLGINFFDSSDAYWGGRHEVLLGRAIRSFRDKVLVTSKFGNIDLPDGKKATNGRPEYLQKCCEESLQRLEVDVIDVYYLHRVDPDVPIEETIGGMARLVEQGKVRWLGVCEAGPETLKRAYKTHPLVALQTEYSLWFREVERDVLPACRELGIAYVAYAPLGRGLLTGRFRSVEDFPPNDRRRKHPRFQAQNLEKNIQLVEALDAMAKGQGATSAQLAIAWLLAQGEDIIPIPGTNHVKNLDLNAAAADIVLSPEKLARISEIFAPGAGAGKRYGETILKQVGI